MLPVSTTLTPVFTFIPVAVYVEIFCFRGNSPPASILRDVTYARFYSEESWKLLIFLLNVVTKNIHSEINDKWYRKERVIHKCRASDVDEFLLFINFHQDRLNRTQVIKWHPLKINRGTCCRLKSQDLKTSKKITRIENLLNYHIQTVYCVKRLICLWSPSLELTSRNGLNGKKKIMVLP